MPHRSGRDPATDDCHAAALIILFKVAMTIQRMHRLRVREGSCSCTTQWKHVDYSYTTTVTTTRKGSGGTWCVNIDGVFACCRRFPCKSMYWISMTRLLLVRDNQRPLSLTPTISRELRGITSHCRKWGTMYGHHWCTFSCTSCCLLCITVFSANG